MPTYYANVCPPHTALLVSSSVPSQQDPCHYSPTLHKFFYSSLYVQFQPYPSSYKLLCSHPQCYVPDTQTISTYLPCLTPLPHPSKPLLNFMLDVLFQCSSESCHTSIGPLFPQLSPTSPYLLCSLPMFYTAIQHDTAHALL